MDAEHSFKRINRYIADGMIGLVRPEVDSVADACRGDMAVLIKCASLLKVIDDETGVRKILGIVTENLPKNDDERFAAAAALGGLGRSEDALNILVKMEETERVLREKARASLASGDPANALLSLKKMNIASVSDTILLTDVLCASGEFEEAYGTAKELAENGGYDALVNLCTVLMRMGKIKEAVKMARGNLKEDRKSADSLALGAYVMRINGKLSAAAGLAHNALKMDHTHIGALETMGLCLAEKKKFIEAKLMAGAINDREPGHPAAIRILDACRIAKE